MKGIAVASSNKSDTTRGGGVGSARRRVRRLRGGRRRAPECGADYALYDGNGQHLGVISAPRSQPVMAAMHPTVFLIRS